MNANQKFMIVGLETQKEYPKTPHAVLNACLIGHIGTISSVAVSVATGRVDSTAVSTPNDTPPHRRRRRNKRFGF